MTGYDQDLHNALLECLDVEAFEKVIRRVIDAGQDDGAYTLKIFLSDRFHFKNLIILEIKYPKDDFELDRRLYKRINRLHLYGFERSNGLYQGDKIMLPYYVPNEAYPKLYAYLRLAT